LDTSFRRSTIGTHHWTITERIQCKSRGDEPAFAKAATSISDKAQGAARVIACNRSTAVRAEVHEISYPEVIPKAVTDYLLCQQDRSGGFCLLLNESCPL